jgi:cytochrome c oxidase cbb3-type subunit 1
MVLSLVFYAASTFEGSMMAIKSVNSFTHYTDWTVAHVHSGAIGWVAMITIGSLYAMAPRALGVPAMHSRAGMELHFWMHVIGLLLYVIAMWISGAVAGMMWRSTEPDGSLTYAFLDSLVAIEPFYVIRFIGGLFVLGGMVVMAWNLWHTAGDARKHLILPITVPIPEPDPHQRPAPLPAAT